VRDGILGRAHGSEDGVADGRPELLSVDALLLKQLPQLGQSDLGVAISFALSWRKGCRQGGKGVAALDGGVGEVNRQVAELACCCCVGLSSTPCKPFLYVGLVPPEHLTTLHLNNITLALSSEEA
jgi:hypothetical protein